MTERDVVMMGIGALVVALLLVAMVLYVTFKTERDR